MREPGDRDIAGRRQAMKAENRQAEWALTVLRVAVGIIFAVHGGQKLMVMGLSNVAGSFGQLGLPAPTLTAGSGARSLRQRGADG
jgi:uncharacterized membrane protein YphA (DoxX/SURF4 family)